MKVSTVNYDRIFAFGWTFALKVYSVWDSFVQQTLTLCDQPTAVISTKWSRQRDESVPFHYFFPLSFSSVIYKYGIPYLLLADTPLSVSVSIIPTTVYALAHRPHIQNPHYARPLSDVTKTVMAHISKDGREAVCTKKKKKEISPLRWWEWNQAAGASFFLLPQSSDPRPRALSALTANTLPSSPFHTYFMLFNATLLFWSFEARFKRARCWIIILKQRRGVGGWRLHKSRKIWAGQGNKHGFQLPFCRPLLQMSPVVIPSRDFKRGAAPLAPSAHTFQVSITRGRASWSLSCVKCQHFAIDLTHSIHKDGASYVREGWGERPFGKVILLNGGFALCFLVWLPLNSRLCLIWATVKKWKGKENCLEAKEHANWKGNHVLRQIATLSETTKLPFNLV